MGINSIGIMMQREDIGFSASHFTIFSETERETLHGHNFIVGVDVYSDHEINGMIFDYCIIKKKLVELCTRLDDKLLLPGNSPFLKFKKYKDNIECFFQDEFFSFPERDVCMLPLMNITLESLSDWFMKEITNCNSIPMDIINEITVYVGSSKGQKVSRRAIIK